MVFSIISICYNDLKNLKNTFQSIRNQTVQDFEWLVIDGNSTDGTKEWLESINYKPLKWISEKDNGIFDAMNKGIDLSKGKFMTFLNSGDCFFDSNTLSEIVTAFSNSPQTLFIYGNALDVTEDGQEFIKHARDHSYVWMGMFAHHQSMFFSTKLKHIKYNLNYPITGDYAYVSEFLTNCNNNQIEKLDITICRFLLGGLNEQKRFHALKEDFRIRRKIQKLGFIKCVILFKLHFFHTLIKRITPGLNKIYRYSKD